MHRLSVVYYLCMYMCVYIYIYTHTHSSTTQIDGPFHGLTKENSWRAHAVLSMQGFPCVVHLYALHACTCV